MNPILRTPLQLNLKTWMATTGHTPKSLSLAAGMGETAVGDILRGRSKHPRHDTLEKLAQVLGCTAYDLLQGSEEPPVGTASKDDGHAEAVASHSHVEAPLSRVDPGAWTQTLRDVPVRATKEPSEDGTFLVGLGDPVEFVRRPHSLTAAKDVYAIFVVGDAMAPEHNEGDLRFVHPHRPPTVGSSVLVEMENDQEGGFVKVLLARLIDRTATTMIVEQHARRRRRELDLRDVGGVHRLLTINDLFEV